MNLFETIVVFIVTAFGLLYLFNKIKFLLTKRSEFKAKLGQNFIDLLFTLTILTLCVMHINAYIKYINTSVATYSYYGPIMIFVGVYVIWVSMGVKKRQKRMMAEKRRLMEENRRIMEEAEENEKNRVENENIIAENAEEITEENLNTIEENEIKEDLE